MDPSHTSSPVPPDELVVHAGFVRRVALAVLRDDADADDATQDTLATALARGPSVPAARRSWLATVVRNVAAGLRRQGARRHRREERGARSEATPSAADLAARAEMIRLVAEAVAGLDPIDRDVVVLRHYDDLPPREIAARMGGSGPASTWKGPAREDGGGAHWRSARASGSTARGECRVRRQRSRKGWS